MPYVCNNRVSFPTAAVEVMRPPPDRISGLSSDVMSVACSDNNNNARLGIGQNQTSRHQTFSEQSTV